VLDIAGSASPNSVFASKTRKRPGRQQRHLVDVFRTKLWFHHLRIVSGATSTYQMDTLIEARLNLPGPAVADRKNKWRSYRDGKHTPSDALVTAIDARAPQSGSLLNHSVWQALRLDRPVQAGLEGAPHDLLARIHTTADQQSLRIASWNWRMLRALEREANLNGLACWIVLLRAAVGAGDSHSAFLFGLSLCRTLLLCGKWLEERHIAADLASYIEKSILPLAAHDGQSHSFGEQGFVEAARQLRLETWADEGDRKSRVTTKQRNEISLDLLWSHDFVERSQVIVTAA
jgi:hypothetical protein